MKLPRDIRFVTGRTQRFIKLEATSFRKPGEPSSQRIAVPAHNPLRIGTLNSILAAVAAHKNVSKDEVLKGL